MTWRQRINAILSHYPLVHPQYFNGCTPWLWAANLDLPRR